MSLAEAALAAFLLGVSFAAHCAGMCGVFAVRAGTLPRFAAYALGKMVTYALLGTLAGALGRHVLVSLGGAQAWLGLGAGLVTLALGVRALRPPRPAAGGAWAALVAPFTDAVSRARASGSAFLLGLATGALPCGAVYSAAVVVTATASPVDGALAMAAFGLGTAPVLAVTAIVGKGALLRLGPSRVRVGGATLVLVTGAVMILRSALPLLRAAGGEVVPCCH